MSWARVREMGFRGRVTLVTTAVVLGVGAAIVIAMVMIVRTVAGASGVVSGPPGGQERYEVIDGVLTPVRDSADALDPVFVVSQDQIGQLIGWSTGLIVLFAVVAWVLSRWTAGQAMARIAEVTRTAQQIGTEDLSRRLHLAGPADEIKELGDTIDSMLARLEEAFEAQARFVANASHELRTPLTVTQTSLEIPLEQGLIGAEARPDIERALASARHSEELITGLLELADTTRPVAVDAGVDLAELIRAGAQDLADAASADHVALDIMADEALIVEGNEALLRRAVFNVLHNAVQHNIADGFVRVRASASGDHVNIDVTNSGPLIAAELVARLVEPFRRGTVRATSEIGRRGYGLGLAIVNSAVAAHDGELSLSARQEGGLVVRLALPLSRSGNRTRTE